MKTIAIISDTHGRPPRELWGLLEGCDALVHAGDICDSGQLDDFRLGLEVPVHAVLGNCDYPEFGKDVGRFAKFEIEGVRFVVAHKPNDVRLGITGGPAYQPGEPLARVAIHGHTHEVRIETGSAARPYELLLCPGSPTRPRGGFPRSIALLRINEGKLVDVRVIDLNGKTILEHVFRKAE